MCLFLKMYLLFFTKRENEAEIGEFLTVKKKDPVLGILEI